MGDGATDQEIADGFRAWLELPAEATPEQMWAARPGRVAVHRRLRAEPDPIDFIELLLRSATDARSMALICENVKSVINDSGHPATVHAVFERSEVELWATLSLHIFGPESYTFEWEGSPINLAQAVEAYTWMGGELEPGEKSRYHHEAFAKVVEIIGDRESDPVPLLALLLRVARDDAELGHIYMGAFEDAYDGRKEHRARILELARFDPELVEMLERR